MTFVGAALLLAGVGVLVARHRVLAFMWAQLDRASKNSGTLRVGIAPSMTLVIVVGCSWIVLGSALIGLDALVTN